MLFSRPSSKYGSLPSIPPALRHTRREYPVIDSWYAWPYSWEMLSKMFMFSSFPHPCRGLFYSAELFLGVPLFLLGHFGISPRPKVDVGLLLSLPHSGALRICPHVCPLCGLRLFLTGQLCHSYTRSFPAKVNRLTGIKKRTKSLRMLCWILWRLPFPHLELTATLLWPCAVGFFARFRFLSVSRYSVGRLFISRRRLRSKGLSHKQAVCGREMGHISLLVV